MRQFLVPQFIEVEDKIFGPLTLKQFIYLLGAGGIAFILYALLPFIFFIIVATPIVGFLLAITFYKKDNQPFLQIVANALSFFTKPRLFLWKKRDIKREKRKVVKGGAGAQIKLPSPGRDKLKDLAWSLDVKEKIK